MLTSALRSAKGIIDYILGTYAKLPASGHLMP